MDLEYGEIFERCGFAESFGIDAGEPRYRRAFDDRRFAPPSSSAICTSTDPATHRRPAGVDADVVLITDDVDVLENGTCTLGQVARIRS